MTFQVAWKLVRIPVAALMLLAWLCTVGLAQQSENAPLDQASESVKFSAADSLKFRIKGTRVGTLFGNARVEHTSGSLTSGQITLNLNESLMSAQALNPADTLSQPVLSRGEENLRSERILYNYKTQKGKFDVARVTMDKGAITGTQVKRTAPHVIFIEDAIYSTCTLDHPHYYLKASRMKIVDEDEVFFTRARLFILDIPYPLVFPFGYLPSRLERNRSGILEPSFSFQDQNRRGLGLQNLGWFQYINDYLTTTLQGDVFTSGTYFLSSRTQYNYQGKYRGSVGFSYSLDRGLEESDPDFTKSVQRMFSMQHSQTISPYATFNADITLRTSDFYNRNSYNIADRANTNTTSRVGYNYRHPAGAYTFGVNVSQSQNFRDNSVSLQGPSGSFSVKRVTPFQPAVRRLNAKWYESLSFGYSNRFNTRFNFNPISDADPDINWIDALLSPEKYRQATGRDGHVDYGLTHAADVSAQLIPSDYANLTASFRMNEYWYPETVTKRYDQQTNRVITEIDKGFAAARDFSASLSLGTTLYGISTQRLGSFEGFRHTMRPSVSYNVSPDFSSSFWGYFDTVQSDSLGNSQRYSKFERGLFGGPSAGEQQSIALSIDNVFETKQVSRDTTGQKREQIIRLIDSFRASLAYNFAADQFKLSDLNTSMNTSFVKGVSINAAANFSFYDRDSLGIALPQYLWDNGSGILRLTRFSVRASTQFRSGATGLQTPAHQPFYPRNYDPFDQELFRAYSYLFNQGPIQSINVPWSFGLSFDYSWRSLSATRSQRTAVINAQNIQFRITPEWQASTSMGYDFISKDITPTRFSITRALHCWDLSFEWNPFGEFQYYMFRLTVRDSQIQGLFQKLPGLNNLERSSSPINRGGYY
jgi:hypothetical protein